MKILVTGANGFVGRALVKALVLAGHVVDALDRCEDGFWKDQAIRHFYVQDITVPFMLNDAWDVVYHLAAHNVTHVGDATGEMYERINVKGTAHVIKAAPAGRFIFLSTVKVYERHAGAIDESGALAPVGLYERSKLEAENLCRQLIAPENLVILRSVNIFGAGQPDKAAVPVFFRKALRGEPIEIFGPRRQCLQLLDVLDMAGFLSRVAAVPGVNGIFNVAARDIIRLDELVLLIKDICSSSSVIEWRNNDDEDEVRYACARTQTVFGWTPQMSLKQSLQKCYDFYGRQE
ncbi:MAG: NAD(P)-dependent oxidoreductase [Candidatus Omnitrophota bacterium]